MIGFLCKDIHRSCLLHLDRSVNVLHWINVLQLLDMWSASCTKISTALVCYTWTGLSMFYTVLMCYSYWICDQLLVQWYPPFLSVTPGPVCQCFTLYQCVTATAYVIGFLCKDIHRSCLLHLDRSVNVLHWINVLQLLDMWSASCTKISTALVCYTWTGLSMFYTVLMCYSYWICDRFLVQRYPPFLSVTPGPVCQCSTLY